MAQLPPSPFISSSVDGSPPSPADTAVASSDLQPRATAEAISVSDGALFSSPPKREMEPSATLALASSETEGAVSVSAASSDNISEPSMTNGGDQGTPAAAHTKNPDAGVLADIDCINEIFFYARKLMKQPRFMLDTDAFMAEVEEVPMFVRDGDHLRRWEA